MPFIPVSIIVKGDHCSLSAISQQPVREWAVTRNFSWVGLDQPYLRQKSLETSLQLTGQDENMWVKSPGSVC